MGVVGGGGGKRGDWGDIHAAEQQSDEKDGGDGHHVALSATDCGP